MCMYMCDSRTSPPTGRGRAGARMPPRLCIDSTVVLTASQSLGRKTIFALIGENTATECQLVRKEYAEAQSWEKLELIKCVLPTAQPIGILFSGFGLEPYGMDIPTFGNYALLIDIDSQNHVQYKAYKRKEPRTEDTGDEWIPSQVSVDSDPASRIAAEEVAGSDKRLALQLLRHKVSDLMETPLDKESLQKFAQLRKISYLNTNSDSHRSDSNIPPEEVSYEMLRQLANRQLP